MVFVFLLVFVLVLCFANCFIHEEGSIDSDDKFVEIDIDDFYS